MPSSLFALLDDIASILDDVSVLTKVAAKKTAGVLGDDLALNAQQVAGVRAERELPVVWAVAKGSLVNKAILVPAALVISTFAPWGVTPLLVLGGAYLCFEGVEKVAHKVLHRGDVAARVAQRRAALVDEAADLVALERDKIKGAVRTDFVLSAEIVVITLGTVADEPFGQQVTVLAAIAALMTVGVYGLVAGIVKLDDAGLALSRRSNRAAATLGRAILFAAPWLMRTLSVVGTAAMFLVGGGILTHGVPVLHALAERVASVAMGALGTVISALFDAAIGVALGLVVLGAATLAKRVLRRRARAS